MAGTDGDSLRILLSAWLDAPIMAPDLKTAGLSLVGARLLANDHGPAALLVYETAAGELVTCYITAEAKRLAPGKVYLEDAAAGSLAWPRAPGPDRGCGQRRAEADARLVAGRAVSRRPAFS